MGQWRWILFAVALTVLWILWLAPATLLANLVAASGVEMQGLRGSLWAGSARSVRLQLPAVRGQRLVFDLGEVSWRLRPLSLLRLQACASVDAQLKTQMLQAEICHSLSGEVIATNVRLQVPANYLGLLSSLEASGQLMLAFDRLRLDGERLVELEGAGRLENLAVLMDKEWLRTGSMTLSFSTDPSGEFRASAISDDKAIALQSNADTVALTLAGPQLLLRSQLTVSPSYQLQWGEGLSMLGFELRDGSYYIDIKLP